VAPVLPVLEKKWLILIWFFSTHTRVKLTEQEGCRSGIFIVDVERASQVPSFAEPFFLKFNAACEFRIAMSPQDLIESGLDELGTRWG